MRRFTVIAALACVGLLSIATAGAASTTTEEVTPSDLALDYNSWFFYNDTADSASASELPGKYEFVSGPGTPPAGVGSVRFQNAATVPPAPPPNERWNMATVMFHGTALSSFTALKFNTYQPSSNPGSTTNAIYLNFDVDFDGAGATYTAYQGRLVYVPRDNGTVLQNQWQEWDAINSGNALWRWSRFASNGNKWLDGNTSALRTWSDIVSSFSGVAVRDVLFQDRFLFRSGEPYNSGFTGYLDKASIGIGGDTTIYDFEPALSPATKDDCKNGGWQTFNTPRHFKNQGDCIQYFNTGK